MDGGYRFIQESVLIYYFILFFCKLFLMIISI